MKKTGLKKEKAPFCPLPPKGGFIINLKFKKSPLGDIRAKGKKDFLTYLTDRRNK
jgi:hypothetical protein